MLNYITISRDTIPAAAKENVYVAAYGPSTDQVFDLVQSLSFIRDFNYYLADPAGRIPSPGTPGWEEHLFFLRNVKAVILVFTGSSIDNAAIDNPAAGSPEPVPNQAELAFLSEEHIPVLPVRLPQQGDFSPVSGSRQFHGLSVLDYIQPDFEELANDFFQALTQRENLEQQVEQVLFGKIFLGFRRKNIEEAYELTRLLRKTKNCSRMGLWYDHSLTPEEVFDEEISRQISSCDLFVMAVTPQLLEKDNYVLKYEYPQAIAEKKLILAVEVRPTDHDAFARAFPGCRLFSMDKQHLNDLIWMLRQVSVRIVTSHPNQAGRNMTPNEKQYYLLAEAFLQGVLVEKDVLHGFRLMRKAERAGSIPAEEHIIRLLRYGIGCDTDDYEAWMKQSSKTYHFLTEYKADANPYSYRFYLESALDGVRILAENISMILAEKELQKLLPVSLAAARQEITGPGIGPGTIYLLLGQIASKSGNLQKAAEYLKEAGVMLHNMYTVSPSEKASLEYASYFYMAGLLLLVHFSRNRDGSTLNQAADLFCQTGQLLKEASTRFQTSYDLSGKVQNVLLHCAFLMEKSGMDPDRTRALYLQICEDGIELCKLRGTCLDRYSLASGLIRLANVGLEVPDRELLMKTKTLLQGLCLERPEKKEYRSALQEVSRRIRIWPGTTD